jgi:type II secretory pathway component PulM
MPENLGVTLAQKRIRNMGDHISRQWLGEREVCYLVTTICLFLAGCRSAPVAPEDNHSEKIEKQLNEIRAEAAEIRRSQDEIKRLLEALTSRIENIDDRRLRSSSQKPDGVRLTIKQVDESAVPQDEVTIEVTVTNDGTRPIGWDREFAVFMDWHVTTDKGVELKSVPIADVQRPAPDSWKSRFVTIAPSKSLSKQVKLTDGFLEFFSGVGYSPGNANPIPVAGEKRVKFVLPSGTRSLKIQVRYIGLQGIGHPEMGFAMEFGQGARAVGLPEEEVTSNTIELSVKDSSP